MTEESETDATVREKFAAASSADTMRSRVRTEKLARQLRSSWHDEWESAAAGSPEAYSLQSYFVGRHRASEFAEGR
jgi:NAD(P)H-dependent flavin oxidoreductase YrpB (nitropropane dioxygenase family)